MIDTDKELRTWLQSIGPLLTLIGLRSYPLKLAKGYHPVADGTKPLISGAALVFQSRGGPQVYSGKLLNLSYQFQSYGQDEDACRAVAGALHDGINLKSFGPWIRGARLENAPVLLTEPDTGWYFALSFYILTFANP